MGKSKFQFNSLITMVINNDGLTPVDQTKLVITKPKSTAAGIPAVISSTIHSLKKLDGVKYNHDQIKCLIMAL